MSSPAIKRKRSSNWGESEKELLLGLYEERSVVLGDKTVDSNTNQAKTRAWKDLVQSFNNLTSGVTRDLAQIKTQWKAMKLDAKRRLCDHRAEVRKTGGGAKPPSPHPQDYKLLEMMPGEFVVDSNMFDSDANQEVIVEADVVLDLPWTQESLGPSVSATPVHVMPKATKVVMEADMVMQSQLTQYSLDPAVTATPAHVMPKAKATKVILEAGMVSHMTQDSLGPAVPPTPVQVIPKAKATKKRTFDEKLKERLLDVTIKCHENDDRRREVEHQQLLKQRREYHSMRLQHQLEAHEALMDQIKGKCT